MIEELRNRFIDELAREYVAYGQDVPSAHHIAARRLIEAIDGRPEIGREFQLRHRDLSWNEMWIATAGGIRGTDTGICHSWHDFDLNTANGSWEWRYPPHRTGWFTGVNRNGVRVRRELRDNGRVYSEVGGVASHALDAYTDIQWEDVAPARQYTEEEVRKAWIYSENVYSWKAFQRELHKGENE